jgi:U3 small nucleolar RNA-associated protein 10
LDGLNELISINPALFLPFEESVLFSEEAKRIERVVEDAEFNARLDGVINEFLIALYPYMMIKASLKCMEWLVYRSV